MDDLTQQVEEIEALLAIYGQEFQIEDEENKVYSIQIMNEMNKNVCVTLQIKLPECYPSTSPPEFEISAPYLKREDKTCLCHLLDEVYLLNIGETIIFQCIEKIREGLNDMSFVLDKLENEDFENLELEPSCDNTMDVSKCPIITHGEVICDRKSSFQGHSAAVFSIDDVRQVVRNLKKNRKIEHATHNIYAYRIYNEKTKTFLHDCDDDGESQAGSRLLHLLEIVDAKNVVVMVSRWYGGIHLGPDRFKHINNAARQALNAANLIPSK